MSRFDGKSVIVTGAGSGIGEATVRLLHGQGASVVAADVDQEALDRVAAARPPVYQRSNSDPPAV